MALTMTRTRTQTALTKLVELVANLHGELAFLDEQLETAPEGPLASALATRKEQALLTLDAVYVTVKQFDPALDPLDIGRSDSWLLPYARTGSKGARARYLRALPPARELAIRE